MISSVNILEIGLEYVASLTLEDDVSLNLVFEFLKSLVFGPLFSGLSSSLLSDLVLLGRLYPIDRSLLDSLIFCLDASGVSALCIEDSVNNYFLGAFISGLIFHEEVLDFGHEPWYNFFLNGSMLWCHEDTLA